jgi:hypothetical protein
MRSSKARKAAKAARMNPSGGSNEVRDFFALTTSNTVRLKVPWSESSLRVLVLPQGPG